MTETRRLHLLSKVNTHDEVRALLVKVSEQGFRIIADPDRRGIAIETYGRPLSPEACLLMMREGEAFDTIVAMDRVLDAVLDEEAEEDPLAELREPAAPALPWWMVGTIGGLLLVLTFLVCRELAR
jgi:hypothetical protein